MRALVTTMVGVFLAAPAAAEAPLWDVDHDASRIGFVGRQNDNEVRGRFEEFEATVRFAPDQLATSSVRVEVDMASAVVEGGGERQEVLFASAWFNVEDFPRAVFTAETFEATDEGWRALGTLTMKGVEREVPVAFTVDIAEGYHIYGPSVAGSGLSPTRLALLAPTATFQQVQFPEPTAMTDPATDRDVPVYRGRIAVTATLQLDDDASTDAPAGDRPITLRLTAQPCDARACYQPTSIDLPIDISRK